LEIKRIQRQRRIASDTDTCSDVMTLHAGLKLLSSTYFLFPVRIHNVAFLYPIPAIAVQPK
jgi:hypothetical protein